MAAKNLLKRIALHVERSVSQTGDVDTHEIAEMLDQALANPDTRAALLLGLAEYIAAAINGAPIQLEAWAPAKQLPRRARH